jgi:hypothetical protein
MAVIFPLLQTPAYQNRIICQDSPVLFDETYYLS